MHFPCADFCSNGMHLHVAPSALSFMLVSHSSWPQNSALAIFLLLIAFKKSLKLWTSTMLFSKSFVLIVIFSFVSLLTNTSWSASTSFGPISILNGTPFNSHSLNFHPGVYPSLSSSSTAWFFNFNFFAISLAFVIIDSLFSLKTIGTTTTCTGAILGGIINHLSSPCTMTIAPIVLVLSPQDVCHANF